MAPGCGSLPMRNRSLFRQSAGLVLTGWNFGADRQPGAFQAALSDWGAHSTYGGNGEAVDCGWSDSEDIHGKSMRSRTTSRCAIEDAQQYEHCFRRCDNCGIGCSTKGAPEVLRRS